MHTQNIRRQFLNYFKKQNHSVISSSSVVPHDDPTLLFINAGMNQFKDVFLGKSLRDYTRATTSQKCIRVGGKHNDLENVGHTSRHLTFFEMLGNFSFGDYFKADAIKFAWEISTEVFGFDPERIWPTVFLDDDEAFELWTKYVPQERITRLGEESNFWAMGDTGPCGPCSELLYDRGPQFGSGRNPVEDLSGERFLEFWNLVFMQYNRSSQGSMERLPKPSIDTGAGLERVVSLKMNVDSLFETDLLRSLIAQIENVSGIAYDPQDFERAPAFRVIADHLRCLSFAIADGVQPSNVDRGYVLRKILRRAVRYGRQLGMEDPFLGKILPRLVSEMGSDYHELKTAELRIAEILTTEEEAFIRTLRRGGSMLSQIIEKAVKQDRMISGDDAFKLKDTYGLPVEEILLLAKDGNLSVDLSRYQILEAEAKKKSRSAHKVTEQTASESLFAEYMQKHADCKFCGYERQEIEAKITAILVDGKFVPSLHEGQEGVILLDQTVFYAEMGGQIGDSGSLKGKDSNFQVTSTESPYKGIITHSGRLLKGSLTVGDTILATIDKERRQKIANNHTATHLLHWALQSVLGGHIKQAGSIVDSQRLRFDFSHHKAVSQEEIYKIEDLINAKIRENNTVQIYELSYEEAQNRADIKQFFGEKYGSKVRVVDIDYSKELCGGTHTQHVGTIGFFRIAKESSIAAGIRRIEGVTGEEAESISRHNEELLATLAATLKTQIPKLSERIEKLIEENKQLAAELKNSKKQELSGLIANLTAKVEIVDGIPLLAAQVNVSVEELRNLAEQLLVKLPSIVLVLAAPFDDKCQLIVRVSEDLIQKGFKANEIIKALNPLIEGSGGGKANGAQAGGKAPHKIPAALAKAKELLYYPSRSPQ